MPTVSIILPTYDGTPFLRLAIDSVFAQTFADWELIVADDGSGEETTTYLRGLESSRVRVLYFMHSGRPSRARNAALEAATGRYVAFMDSDDLWEPNKLARQLSAMHAEQRCEWSYTAFTIVDAEGTPLASECHRRWTPHGGHIFEEVVRARRVDSHARSPREHGARAGGRSIRRGDRSQRGLRLVDATCAQKSGLRDRRAARCRSSACRQPKDGATSGVLRSATIPCASSRARSAVPSADCSSRSAAVMRWLSPPRSPPAAVVGAPSRPSVGVCRSVGNTRSGGTRRSESAGASVPCDRKEVGVANQYRKHAKTSPSFVP